MSPTIPYNTWLSSIILIFFASLLLETGSVQAATETVTLKNGKTYKVKTKAKYGDTPGPATSRQVNMTFFGVSSPVGTVGTETQQYFWTWSASLKKRGRFKVTVTTPLDDTISTSFERSGPGKISGKIFESEKYPTLWTWIDDPEKSWLPFVFSFEDTKSGKAFEIMQWAVYSAEQKTSFKTRATRQIAETITPPFDNRDWQLGRKSMQEYLKVREYVLVGESVENWSELITVQSVARMQEINTPEAWAQWGRREILKNCPDAMWNIIRQSEDEIVYESRTEGCVNLVDSEKKYEISKMMKGSSAMHRVAYATKQKPHLSDIKRSEWIDRIGGAKLVVQGAATDEVVPPLSKTPKTKFLVKGGRIDNAGDVLQQSPRVPTNTFLIKEGQVGVMGDFPRPYPTIPTKAILVDGGSIGIQAGVRPDLTRPPLLPFGKKKYPTTYFVFLTNETNIPVWINIHMTFPMKGKKTIERGNIESSVRNAREDHRNTRGFLLNSYGVVTDKKIPINILVFADEERENLIVAEETFVYFAKKEVKVFLKKFRDSPPLYGWPDIGVPDTNISGTVADASLQSDIQYTLWKEESKTYAECEHKTLFAEPAELAHSAIVASMTEEVGKSDKSPGTQRNVLVEYWSVRSCDVTSRYEVLLAETPDVGPNIFVRRIDETSGGN